LKICGAGARALSCGLPRGNHVVNHTLGAKCSVGSFLSGQAKEAYQSTCSGIGGAGRVLDAFANSEHLCYTTSEEENQSPRRLIPLQSYPASNSCAGWGFVVSLLVFVSHLNSLIVPEKRTARRGKPTGGGDWARLSATCQLAYKSITEPITFVKLPTDKATPAPSPSVAFFLVQNSSNFRR